MEAAMVQRYLKAAGSVRVVIEAFPPDRRKRDLDNILKSLLDALTHAGVWEDDSQIEDLRIYRSTIAGMVKVRIYEQAA
ncbi:MAG: RusA family crossover junction endodeoxyribonuclease [Caulobacteraceae bacterium]|nr:RusA family crossover junction endodeoxyribonuclease [Caulobacteraceae bacterium]